MGESFKPARRFRSSYSIPGMELGRSRIVLNVLPHESEGLAIDSPASTQNFSRSRQASSTPPRNGWLSTTAPGCAQARSGPLVAAIVIVMPRQRLPVARALHHSAHDLRTRAASAARQGESMPQQPRSNRAEHAQAVQRCADRHPGARRRGFAPEAVVDLRVQASLGGDRRHSSSAAGCERTDLAGTATTPASRVPPVTPSADASSRRVACHARRREASLKRPRRLRSDSRRTRVSATTPSLITQSKHKYIALTSTTVQLPAALLQLLVHTRALHDVPDRLVGPAHKAT